MGFGPTEFRGNKFKRMTDDELKQYTVERDALLKRWSKGVEADIPLRVKLDEVSQYGMLYYPNGKPVHQADTSEMLGYDEGIAARGSNLVVAVFYPETGEMLYHPVVVKDGLGAVDPTIKLTKEDLKEREKGFAVADAISNINFGAKFRAERLKLWETGKDPKGQEKIETFFEESDNVFSELSDGEMQPGSAWLTGSIETAIRQGIVRYSDGSHLKEEDLNLICETPAMLKNLVFLRYNKEAFDEPPTLYALKFTDDDPIEMQLDTENPVTPDELYQMQRAWGSLTQRRLVPGALAEAMKPAGEGADAVDKEKLQKYAKEMREYGMSIDLIDGLPAFRVKPDGGLYAFGCSKPITTLEELVKGVSGLEPPKEPNRWGPFEFLRKGWHNLFHNVADYVEYDIKQKEYEVTKYHVGVKADFEVDIDFEKVRAYNSEIFNYQKSFGEENVKAHKVQEKKVETDLKEKTRLFKTVSYEEKIWKDPYGFEYDPNEDEYDFDDDFDDVELDQSPAKKPYEMDDEERKKFAQHNRELAFAEIERFMASDDYRLAESVPSAKNTANAEQNAPEVQGNVNETTNTDQQQATII